MPDWICRLCNNIVRARTRPPAYCPRCGVGNFAAAGERSAGSSTPARSFDLQIKRVTVTPEAAPGKAAPGPGQERRRAKRVRAKAHLDVRLCQIALLEALDISSLGLLVEHTTPFKPGLCCEVELCRSGQTVRLRGEVVRSFAVSSGGNSAGLRYRTALQFLETPHAIFALLPELAEEA